MSSFSEIKRRKTEGKKAKFNLPSQLPPTLTIVKLLLCLLRQDIRKKNCAQLLSTVWALLSTGVPQLHWCACVRHYRTVA